MSNFLTVQLSRIRAVVILGCLLIAGVFLFLTGTVSGLLAASKSGNSVGADSGGAQVAAASKTQPCKGSTPTTEPSSPAEASNKGVTDHPASTSVSPATAPVAAQTLAPTPTTSANVPSPGASNAANSSSKSAAPNVATDVVATNNADSDTVPLAVKVCSFATKEGADNMIKTLDAAGFHASSFHSVGENGKSWYVVKLGPFTSWNDASAVATQVAIARNVRPMIGPAR